MPALHHSTRIQYYNIQPPFGSVLIIHHISSRELTLLPLCFIRVFFLVVHTYVVPINMYYCATEYFRSVMSIAGECSGS